MMLIPGLTAVWAEATERCGCTPHGYVDDLTPTAEGPEAGDRLLACAERTTDWLRVTKQELAPNKTWSFATRPELRTFLRRRLRAVWEAAWRSTRAVGTARSSPSLRSNRLLSAAGSKGLPLAGPAAADAHAFDARDRGLPEEEARTRGDRDRSVREEEAPLFPGQDRALCDSLRATAGGGSSHAFK